MATVTRPIRPQAPVANRQQRRRSNRQARWIVQLSALTAAVVGLWALWYFTATSVVIEVDGVEDTILTHRRDLDSLLWDYGLLPGAEGGSENGRTYGLGPEASQVKRADLGLAALAAEIAERRAPAEEDPLDEEGEAQDNPPETVRLSHSLDTRIEEGLRVTVARVPGYVIQADGREISVASWAETPADLMMNAGIAFSPHDELLIEGVPRRWDDALPAETAQRVAAILYGGPAWERIERSPQLIEVNRAVRFAVIDGFTEHTVFTFAETVGEALREEGITVYLGDDVQPRLSAPVSSGLRVLIRRSTPVSLVADGRLYRTRTLSRTVGEALAEAKIGLTGLDEVSPSLSAPLYPDIQIRIVRVREEIAVEEDVEPFATIRIPDINLLIDTTTDSPGALGITRRRYRVQYRDEQEIGRVLEDAWIAQEPRDRVIAYGQKIVPQTYVDESGEEITYWRKIRVRATSYSASTAGVPRSMPWFGITRSGEVMRKGVVAVDPRYIPLHTKVFVPGYGHGDALDTGAAIVNRRIDLGYDDDNLVLWSAWVDIYLLWPPPQGQQIEWELPALPPGAE